MGQGPGGHREAPHIRPGAGQWGQEGGRGRQVEGQHCGGEAGVLPGQGEAAGFIMHSLNGVQIDMTGSFKPVAFRYMRLSP